MLCRTCLILAITVKKKIEYLIIFYNSKTNITKFMFVYHSLALKWANMEFHQIFTRHLFYNDSFWKKMRQWKLTCFTKTILRSRQLTCFKKICPYPVVHPYEELSKLHAWTRKIVFVWVEHGDRRPHNKPGKESESSVCIAEC